MAQTESKGKGASKSISPAQHAENKRIAQARRARRGGKSGGKSGDQQASGTDIISLAQADRETVRAEAREARRQRALTEAFKTALEHLTRFAQKPVPYKEGERARWTENAMAAATALLNLYFFGSEESDLTEVRITEQELGMGERVVAEVRKRFATACFLSSKVKDTPGQEQSWFEAVYTATREFHVHRREERQRERDILAQQAEPTVTAPAETEESVLAAV